jgi:hypothetical protein
MEASEESQDGGGLQKTVLNPDIQEVKRLFRVAGFTNRFIQAHFRQIIVEYDEHWHPFNFVDTYAETLLETLGFEGTISNTLQRIGIKQSAAAYAENQVKHFLEDSIYTHFQVAEVALEILLGHYQSLTPTNEPYFFSKNTVNTWIPFESTRILNLPISCTLDAFSAASHTIQQFNIQFINKSTTVPKKLYFHTTNWRSAIGIQDEIRHEAGRNCLDFGSCGGFYLSDSLSNSLEWGVKNAKPWHNEVAILVFGLPETFPKNYKVKWFPTVNQEWSALTAESRKCLKKKYCPSEIKSIRKYDFIYGPMVKNPEKVKSQNQEPIPHTPLKFQLVSKTTNSDRYLQRYLKGILVFQKDTS